MSRPSLPSHVAIPPAYEKPFRKLQARVDSGELKLFTFAPVIKINSKGKEQDRVLIASLEGLFTCTPGGQICRCVTIHRLSKIIVCGHDIAFVVPDEYDIWMRIPEGPRAFVQQIASVYHHVMEHPLRIEKSEVFPSSTLNLERPPSYSPRLYPDYEALALVARGATVVRRSQLSLPSAVSPSSSSQRDRSASPKGSRAGDAGTKAKIVRIEAALEKMGFDKKDAAAAATIAEGSMPVALDVLRASALQGEELDAVNAKIANGHMSAASTSDTADSPAPAPQRSRPRSYSTTKSGITYCEDDEDRDAPSAAGSPTGSAGALAPRMSEGVGSFGSPLLLENAKVIRIGIHAFSLVEFGAAAVSAAVSAWTSTPSLALHYCVHHPDSTPSSPALGGQRVMPDASRPCCRRGDVLAVTIFGTRPLGLVRHILAPLCHGLPGCLVRVCDVNSDALGALSAISGARFASAGPAYSDPAFLSKPSVLCCPVKSWSPETEALCDAVDCAVVANNSFAQSALHARCIAAMVALHACCSRSLADADLSLSCSLGKHSVLIFTPASLRIFGLTEEFSHAVPPPTVVLGCLTVTSVSVVSSFVTPSSKILGELVAMVEEAIPLCTMDPTATQSVLVDMYVLTAEISCAELRQQAFIVSKPEKS